MKSSVRWLAGGNEEGKGERGKGGKGGKGKGERKPTRERYKIRSLESAHMPVEPHSDGSNRPLLIFPVGFDGVGAAETS